MKQTNTPPPQTPSGSSRLQLSNAGLIWLASVVLVGFLGWWKSINVVFLLAYFMVGLLMFNCLYAYANVRRVKVSQELPPPIYAGEDTVIRLTVANISSRNATVMIDDQICGESLWWLVHNVAGGSTVTCHARRAFENPGRFSAQIRVSSGYPIGLISIDRVAQTNEVTVLPALGVIDPDGFRRWVFRQAGENDRTRKVLRRVTTDQADVRGLRPYRPGDPIRTIHWRSSAHRGELLVREYDAAPAPDLVLVVEPWLPTNPTAVHQANLKNSLSLAATIADIWTRVYGTQVTIVMAGDSDSFRTTTPSDRGVREALIPLASVTGNVTFDPLKREAFMQTLRNVACLVVSSRFNSPYASELTETTGRLFIAVSPSDRLPWYQPPTIGKTNRSGSIEQNAHAN